MNALKEGLMLPPVQALPHSFGNMTLDTDTYEKQIGCVLLQNQGEETTRSIGYLTHTLDDAIKRKDITQRECLAIVWSALIKCPYVEVSLLTLADHAFSNGS